VQAEKKTDAQIEHLVFSNAQSLNAKKNKKPIPNLFREAISCQCSTEIGAKNVN